MLLQLYRQQNGSLKFEVGLEDRSGLAQDKNKKSLPAGLVALAPGKLKVTFKY